MKSQDFLSYVLSSSKVILALWKTAKLVNKLSVNDVISVV